VTEVAPDVTTVKPGDRVMGTSENGGYADEAVVPAGNLTRIPASMEYAVAAGFAVAYGTSHGALEWRARLRPGEVLLVHGRGGRRRANRGRDRQGDGRDGDRHGKHAGQAGGRPPPRRRSSRRLFKRGHQGARCGP